MKDNPRIKLNFFLDLINKDLSKMSQADLFKAYFDLTEIAVGSSPVSEGMTIRDLMVPVVKTKVESIQGALSGLLRRILDPSLHTKRIQFDLDSNEAEWLIDKVTMEVEFVCRKDRIGAEYTYQSIESKLLLDFVNALQHFPLDSIRRCKECQGYFLKGTKKEKEFCSTRCYFKWRRKEEKKHGSIQVGG